MKTIEYRPVDGEDAGKIFVITRMNAFAADLWARKIVQALAREDIFLTEEGMDMGLATLAGHSVAILGQINDQNTSQDAYDTLMHCVKIRRDPHNPAILPAPLLEEDVQDPNTLPALRKEAFTLHVDFLKAVASPIFHQATAPTPVEISSP